MRGLRFDGVLATSALAVVLALTSGFPASADMGEEEAIEAAVPIPEPANVPPPTAAEVRASPAAALNPAQIDARVPLPEAADVAPPSLADVGGPATATTDAKVPDAVAPAAAPPPAAKDVA